MTHEPEYKTAISALEWKEQQSGDFQIEGYGAVFNNVDDGDDVIAPSAIQMSESPKDIKMLWQHDTFEIIGVWNELKSDEHGLRVKGTILGDVQKGKEAIALLKAGAINGLSIGYRTLKATRETRDDRHIRLIQELELWEVSLVTFPMNRAATIDAKTAALMSRRELERALVRDSKFSRSVVHALMRDGFEGVQALSRSGESDNAKLLAGIKNLHILNELKGKNHD